MQRFSYFNQFLKTDAKWLSVLIIIFLFSLLGFNSLVRDVCFSMGLGCSRLDFGDVNDPFADLLKLAMAFIPSDQLREYACKPPGWSPLFLAYLYNNPYLQPGFTHFHMPPLTTVLLSLIAQLITFVGPNLVIWFYVFFFVVMIYIIQSFYARLVQSNLIERIALSYMLIFSYPALFMLARGNLTSYFTIILIVFYIITISSNKHRFFGIICLSAAINIRPNLITFCLIEYACKASFYKKNLSLLVVVVLTGLISGLSYIIAHIYVPGYSIESFLEHVKLYDELYARGDLGWSNNFSLFGLSKTLRNIFQLQPLYDAQIYSFLRLLAVFLACNLFYLAARNSLALLDAVFLSVAYSVLFTPVFAFYHTIEFIAPLIVLMALCSRGEAIDIVGYFIFLSCIFYLSAVNNDKPIVCPLTTLGLIVFIVIRSYRRSRFDAGLYLDFPLRF